MLLIHSPLDRLIHFIRRHPLGIDHLNLTDGVLHPHQILIHAGNHKAVAIPVLMLPQTDDVTPLILKIFADILQALFHSDPVIGSFIRIVADYSFSSFT